MPRIFDRLLTVLGIAVCAAVAFFALYEMMEAQRFSVLILVVVVLFGGVGVHTLWRMVHMGNWGCFYNEEKIIFALSRKDRRVFRWDELQGPQVSIFRRTSPESWHFYFPGKMRVKQITLTPRMTGYDELIAMLRKKGVAAQNANGGGVGFDANAAGDIFRQMFGEDFTKGGRKQ